MKTITICYELHIETDTDVETLEMIVQEEVKGIIENNTIHITGIVHEVYSS